MGIRTSVFCMERRTPVFTAAKVVKDFEENNGSGIQPLAFSRRKTAEVLYHFELHGISPKAGFEPATTRLDAMKPYPHCLK